MASMAKKKSGPWPIQAVPVFEILGVERGGDGVVQRGAVGFGEFDELRGGGFFGGAGGNGGAEHDEAKQARDAVDAAVCEFIFLAHGESFRRFGTRALIER